MPLDHARTSHQTEIYEDRVDTHFNSLISWLLLTFKVTDKTDKNDTVSADILIHQGYN